MSCMVTQLQLLIKRMNIIRRTAEVKGGGWGESNSAAAETIITRLLFWCNHVSTTQVTRSVE